MKIVEAFDQLAQAHAHRETLNHERDRHGVIVSDACFALANGEISRALVKLELELILAGIK